MRIEFCESRAYLACFDGRSIGKPFFCGAGLTRCSIMPDGEVMGCHQIYDISFSEGNIREKPFSQIWKEGFIRFRRDEFPLPCQSCAWRDQCQGGCWAEMEKQGSCLKSVWEDHD
jgi:radical SAM protein with 4Fe4S-binding SPASM domain